MFKVRGFSIVFNSPLELCFCIVFCIVFLTCVFNSRLSSTLILGPLEEKEKQRYLVKTEGAFGHLAAWFPGDERAALQLCLSGANFKTVDPADFRKCCEILDVENADLMQNPVAKAVVKAHHQLLKPSEWDRSEGEAHAAMVFFRSVLEEVASIRLGLPVPEATSDVAVGLCGDSMVAAVRKARDALEPVMRKASFDAKAQANYPLLAKIMRFAEAASETTPTEGCDIQASASAIDQQSVQGGVRTSCDAEPESQLANVMDLDNTKLSELATPTPLTRCSQQERSPEVGDTVIVSCKKKDHKEWYNGCKGTIEHILACEFKVKMIDGALGCSNRTIRIAKRATRTTGETRTIFGFECF